ncbi:hypothetical protein MK079_00675 [Candidatus Gracilibacteria bacterium]|nr:hypothetical protein [Candidatus Gracilibacteria bacterium]
MDNNKELFSLEEITDNNVGLIQSGCFVGPASQAQAQVEDTSEKSNDIL